MNARSGHHERSEATLGTTGSGLGLGYVLVLSPRGPLEIDLVSVVDESIQNSVCQTRISDPGVPLIARQLAGDDCRGGAVAVLHEFQQVVPLCLRELPEPEVVEDEQSRLRDLREELDVGAVGAGEGELVEEARYAPVQDTLAPTTRGLAEGASQIALSDAGLSSDRPT